MATILTHDKLVVVSTGNGALVWNSELGNVKVIEQPTSVEQSSEVTPPHKEGTKVPRRGQTSSEHEERHMACVSLSRCGRWLALASSRGQKQLGLWRTSDWTLESSRPMARAASCVCFTPSGSDIVLADKAGDVFLYSVTDSSKEKIWLLGHIAMLLDVLVTPDEKFIITCDRDEKIRVSLFPNSYHVHAYCLGHDMFVNSLSLLPHRNSTLVSTSGDGTVRLWDYETGRPLLCLDVQENLSPDTPREESPLAIKSCVGKSLGPTSSLLCLCIGGLASCAVFLVSEEGGWTYSLVQRLALTAELWSLALQETRLLTLSPDPQQAVSAWSWREQESTFVSEKAGLEAFNEHWDTCLKSCFVNPSVPSMLYRRKYADEGSKTSPAERPVKILKNK